MSEKGDTKFSADSTTEGTDNGKNAYTIRLKTPNNWMDENFDSKNRPNASIYSEREIGVNNKKAYMNFIEKFSGAGANFICSTDVVLDNEVLLRYEVK